MYLYLINLKDISFTGETFWYKIWLLHSDSIDMSSFNNKLMAVVADRVEISIPVEQLEKFLNKPYMEGDLDNFKTLERGDFNKEYLNRGMFEPYLKTRIDNWFIFYHGLKEITDKLTIEFVEKRNGKHNIYIRF